MRRHAQLCRVEQRRYSVRLASFALTNGARTPEVMVPLQFEIDFTGSELSSGH